MDNLILLCFGSFSCPSSGHGVLDLLGREEDLFMVRQYKDKTDAGLSKTTAVLRPNFITKKNAGKNKLAFWVVIPHMPM